MLRDLELLLNNVYESQTRDYFKEALTCYSNGAYKACVILSVIAGIDDLYNKVNEQFNEFDQIKKNDFRKIERKRDEKKPFERDLIAFCADEELDLFSKYENNDLNFCFDLRNSFAHPSDKICSAEKARFVFSVMIDLISSKRRLAGHQYINKLVDRLKNEDLFYAELKPKSILLKNEDCLKDISKTKYWVLLKRLVTESSADKSSRVNYFLASLLIEINKNKDDNVKLNQELETYISQEILDFNFYRDITRVDPRVYEIFSFENCQRILKSLLSYLNTDLQMYLEIFKSIINSRKIEQKEQIEFLYNLLFTNIFEVLKNKPEIDNQNFVSFLDKMYKLNQKVFLERASLLIEQTEFDTTTNNILYVLISLFLKNNDEIIQQTLIEKLCGLIASQTFEYSNGGTLVVESFTSEDFTKMNEKFIISIFLSLLEGAERGGWYATVFLQQIESKIIFKFIEQNIINDKEELKNNFVNNEYLKKGWKNLARDIPNSSIALVYNEIK